jgi:O-antigen/teichoic acid export membrane protein
MSALNYKFSTQSPGHEEALELLENRYFLLGLALQKGTPILILPLTVAAVGVKVYADYVLLFSLVQVVAVLGSLCVAQALIPFWYGYSEKGNLVSTLSVTMLGLQALFSIPVGIALSIGFTSRMKVSLAFVPIILIFAAVYNLNSIGLNLVRIQLKQVAFFWSTLFTAALLTGSIVLLAHATGPRLLLYTTVNVLILGLQTWFYFYFSRIPLSKMFRGERLRTCISEILKFSVPLTVYTLIALAALVADKWIVKGFFSPATFAQYVLDFQFAFGVTLVSMVIGMYNTPKQCELVQKGASVGLRRNVLGNYTLSLVGSIGAAVAGFAYADFGKVQLSRGYWILVLSFALNNCYVVNSSLLTAQKRSRTIAMIGGVSTFAFIVTLILCGLRHAIGPVYVAWVGYELLLLLLSTLSIIAVLRFKEESEHGFVDAGSLSRQ